MAIFRSLDSPQFLESHNVLYCGLLVGRRDHMPKWSAALRAETNLIIDAHTFAPVNQEGVTGSKCKDKNILITGDLPLSSMFICSDSVNFKRYYCSVSAPGVTSLM